MRKIGVTKTPKQRLINYQTSSPYEYEYELLLKVEDCTGYDIELKLKDECKMKKEPYERVEKTERSGTEFYYIEDNCKKLLEWLNKKEVKYTEIDYKKDYITNKKSQSIKETVDRPLLFVEYKEIINGIVERFMERQCLMPRRNYFEKENEDIKQEFKDTDMLEYFDKITRNDDTYSNKLRNYITEQFGADDWTPKEKQEEMLMLRCELIIINYRKRGKKYPENINTYYTNNIEYKEVSEFNFLKNINEQRHKNEVYYKATLLLDEKMKYWDDHVRKEILKPKESSLIKKSFENGLSEEEFDMIILNNK
jgi:glutaredoxin